MIERRPRNFIYDGVKADQFKPAMFHAFDSCVVVQNAASLDRGVGAEQLLEQARDCTRMN